MDDYAGFTIFIIGIFVAFVISLVKVDKKNALPEYDERIIQKILDSKISKAKKKKDLIDYLIPMQFVVESETKNYIQFVRKTQFSYLYAVLWFLFFGFGLILYWILHNTNGYERINMDL